MPEGATLAGANGVYAGNGITRSNGETEIGRRERHTGEAGHSAGRWIEHRRNHKPTTIAKRLVNCGGALSKPARSTSPA